MEFKVSVFRTSCEVGRRMLRKLQIAKRYFQGLAGLQKEDVILASYQKSGNTWVRFFLCNIISECEWGGRTVDFHLLDRTMPELGVSNLMEPWPHVAIPRFVKTHKNYWPIFRNRKSVLVVRDPRDVMVSYYYMRKGYTKSPFRGTFSQFLKHRKYGLKSWFDHYRSWKPYCTVVVEYERLREDDVSGFNQMLSSLEIVVSPEVVRKAARKAGFDQMGAIERQLGLSNAKLFNADYTFIRQGKSGTWREHFSSDDVAYFESIREQYGPSLEAWSGL